MRKSCFLLVSGGLGMAVLAAMLAMFAAPVAARADSAQAVHTLSNTAWELSYKWNGASVDRKANVLLADRGWFVCWERVGESFEYSYGRWSENGGQLTLTFGALGCAPCGACVFRATLDSQLNSFKGTQTLVLPGKKLSGEHSATRKLG